MESPTDRILELTDRRGLVRARDVAAAGIPTAYLTRLTRSGVLERVGRGLYGRPDTMRSQHVTLAEVARQVPKGVVCLVSALRFHDLGNQRPHRVWLALPPHTTTPKAPRVALEVVRMAPPMLAAGVQDVDIDGVPVRVFDPSKTIADLFRFRNRVGLDVAVEGLRAYWESPHRNVAALERYARIDRVATVLRPYLEAMAA